MNKDVKGSLLWAGGLIALALAASFARARGYIDPEATTRIVLAAIGLMVAWFGNRMPKSFVASAHMRRVNRLGGWSMALSGLVYATLWAVAPFEVALWAGCGAILAGMAVTVSYCLALRNRPA